MLLVCWDIDRTLIDAAGVDKQAWLQACSDISGRRITQLPVGTSGRTDPQILLDILTSAGILTPDAAALLPAVLEREAVILASHRDQLARKGKALPGAREALAALADEPGVLQTVVTGNVRPNAELKLAAFDLDRHLDLDLGGYGSDSPDRATLIGLARQRTSTAHRLPIQSIKIVVVGDSPRDIDAARAARARSVGVATGRSSIDELAAAGGDAVLEDLTDTDSVYAAILGRRLQRG